MYGEYWSILTFLWGVPISGRPEPLSGVSTHWLHCCQQPRDDRLGRWARGGSGFPSIAQRLQGGKSRRRCATPSGRWVGRSVARFVGLQIALSKKDFENHNSWNLQLEFTNPEQNLIWWALDKQNKILQYKNLLKFPQMIDIEIWTISKCHSFDFNFDNISTEFSNKCVWRFTCKCISEI